MTHEQYIEKSRALQEQYDVVNLPKVCNERVDYLVDLCNVKTDYILQLEEQLKQNNN